MRGKENSDQVKYAHKLTDKTSALWGGGSCIWFQIDEATAVPMNAILLAFLFLTARRNSQYFKPDRIHSRSFVDCERQEKSRTHQRCELLPISVYYNKLVLCYKRV